MAKEKWRNRFIIASMYRNEFYVPDWDFTQSFHFQGQHYVSVDETDVISVVKGLEEKSKVSELTSMTDEAQGFAYR